MTTVRDLLRDADPLRAEPLTLPEQRHRLRRAVVAAVSDVAAAPRRSVHMPVAFWVAAVLLAVALVAVASQLWSRGATNLQAAVRFEVRLAEEHPGAGLQAARVSGSDQVVYLHSEIILTNSDIAQSRIIPGDGPSRFGISVEFTDTGTQKMRAATADHVGRPMVVLIDGNVVAAPVVRGPIGAAATISGDYTRADAERIVSGMALR